MSPSLHARRPHRPHPPRHARGFTLIELMVTLVVVSVGLLGLAKLQAAAMAETQVSRVRALMTMQAESLASMMRANRGYWGSTTSYASASVTSTGTTSPTVAGATLDTSAGVTTNGTLCTAACTPARLAYDDLRYGFGPTFSQQFASGSTATIVCSGSATLPTTCDITLSWVERGAVAVNRTANDATATAVKPVTMVLHVQP